MTKARAIIEEQAVGWIIRVGDPQFADWEAFTAWLEEDPAHSQIYDEMALVDLEAADLLKAAPTRIQPPAQPRRSGPNRRSVMGWAGAAAAALVAVSSYAILAPGSSPYAVETAAGAHRTVALADGSRIDLNGATRLILDRDDPRVAKLDHGEAYFTVVHDESRPFIVETGGATLMDVGTAFNVVRADGVTEVAVSEGEILYNPETEKVAVPAGKALRAIDGEAELRLSDAAPGNVASWRRGRLIYSGTPRAMIASDLSRNLGVRVTAASDVAAMPFSGVILLDTDHERVLRRVGALLGVEARRVEGGWLLTEPADGAR